MNTLVEKTKVILRKRKKLHPNDSASIYKIWEDLVFLLSTDINATIYALEEMAGEEILYISEVFEDIYYKTWNHDYIDCLKRLDLKFPELNLSPFIPNKN